MFHFVNNYRFYSEAAVWAVLVLGLFLLATGCRSLSSQSKSVLPPPVSVAAIPDSAKPLPEKTIAVAQPLPSSPNSFRPLMFNELPTLSKTPTEKITVSRPVTPEPVVIKKEVLPPQTKPVANTADKAEMDAMKRRISELEQLLADSKVKAEQAKVNEAVTASKPPRRVPTFNEPGVTVSSDAERIRIEITDQTLFVPGTWKLNPEAENLLRKVAGEIRAGDPDASLEIEGHTDCVTTDPANTMQKHDIASLKAMTVMEYFVKVLQWKTEKIRPTSFGSSRPVADNGTPEGRIRNNRIEIVVLPPK